MPKKRNIIIIWFACDAKTSSIIPPSGLKDAEKIEKRERGEKAVHADRKKQQRDLGDIIRKVNKYAFIACACGLKMKVPPEYKKKDVKCPRCGRSNPVPPPELIAAAAAAAEGIKTKNWHPTLNKFIISMYRRIALCPKTRYGYPD